MAITCVEKADSREYTEGRSAELTFVVRGTADEAAAVSAIKAAAPATFQGLFRQTVSVEPLSIDTAHPDNCLWNGGASYASHEPEEPPATGGSVFNFDTGGGQQHLTQSLATVGRYPNEAPDFKGAIGVTEDSVEGVDITVPVFNFSETHYVATASVTPAYRLAIFALTGKVNSGTFRGFAAGECLFLGASGSRRGAEDWEITFRFAVSPNKVGLSVGSINGIAKQGWEYLWVRYADQVDAVSQALVKAPVAVYVERVYESGDFAGLALGS